MNEAMVEAINEREPTFLSRDGKGKGYVCPQCGSEIELFTCDTQAVCEHCGFVVYNDTLSCVQWCKYARQCVGDAMYEQMMAIAERQKANRKLRKSEDNTHDQTDH